MPEHIKQPLMIGAIAGALTVISYQIVFNSGFGRGQTGSVGGVFIAIALGLLVGGIAGGIMYAVVRNR